MAIEINLQEPDAEEIEVDGETISVRWEPRARHSGGVFRATYHGQFLNVSTLEAMRNAVRRIRTDQADKARREQARKAAAVNPLPAVAVRGERWIERVGVRGRHATTKEPLVTFANGSKGGVIPRFLLRDLNDEEYDRVEKAVTAHAAAREEAKGTEGGRSFDLGRQYDLTLDASYDATVDLWVAEYDGQRFTGKDATDVGNAVEAHLLRRDYPFVVADGKVVDLREGDAEGRLGGGRWATADEAQRYIDAHAVQRARLEELEPLLAEFRFDLSVFED